MFKLSVLIKKLAGTTVYERRLASSTFTGLPFMIRLLFNRDGSCGSMIN